MPGVNIVLCGFMASGKSTVGRLLSEATGMPLVDTDALIERETGRSIEDIFQADGQPFFRELERKVVDRESRREAAVLAVGGGAVLDPVNRRALKSGGVVYHLSVSAEEVECRAAGGGRPLLPGGRREILSLMDDRADAYARAADVVVETDGRTPADVARDILDDFRARAEEK